MSADRMISMRTSGFLSRARNNFSRVAWPALYPQSSALLGMPLPFSSQRFHTQSSDGFKQFLEPKIEKQSKRFEQHPLLREWLTNNRSNPRRALAYMTPLMIEFVMGFRDYNEHYLRYAKDQRYSH